MTAISIYDPDSIEQIRQIYNVVDAGPTDEWSVVIDDETYVLDTEQTGVSVIGDRVHVETADHVLPVEADYVDLIEWHG